MAFICGSRMFVRCGTIHPLFFEGFRAWTHGDILRYRLKARASMRCSGRYVGFTRILVRESFFLLHAVCVCGGSSGQGGIPVKRREAVCGSIAVGQVENLLGHLVGLLRCCSGKRAEGSWNETGTHEQGPECQAGSQSACFRCSGVIHLQLEMLLKAWRDVISGFTMPVLGESSDGVRRGREGSLDVFRKRGKDRCEVFAEADHIGSMGRKR